MEQRIRTAIRNYTGYNHSDVVIDVIPDEFVSGTYAARVMTPSSAPPLYFLVTGVFRNTTIDDIENSLEDVEYTVWPPKTLY